MTREFQYNNNSETESYKIIKIVLFSYMIILFLNILIFIISEYEHTRKELLNDFRILANSVSRPLSEVLWRNNTREIKHITSSILENPYVTGLRIEDDKKNIVMEKIKSDNKKFLSTKFEIIYEYDRRELKVGDLYIFTNYLKVIHKMESAVFIVMMKSFIETVAIVILMFWGFKRLFTRYLKNIQKRKGGKELVQVNFSFFNSIAILEKAFLSIIDHFFSMEEKNSDVKNEVQSKNKEIENLKSEIDIYKDEITNFQKLITPDKELLQKYFSDIFLVWMPKNDKTGDNYIFMEINQGKEVIILIVDYGASVNPSFLSMILKDIERDIFNSSNSIGRMLSTNKLLNFVDKKIRKKLQVIGMKISNEAQYKAIALNYNKEKQLARYSYMNMALFYVQEDELVVPEGDATGVYKSSDGNYLLKEHIIATQIPTSIYMITDGFYRQIGGEKGNIAYGKDRLKETISNILKMPFLSQEKAILDSFNNYKNKANQVDDVTMIGIRLNS